MSVSTPCQQYEEMAPVWKKCRDCEGGQRYIHAAGAAYLPRLKDQDDDSYNAYKARATFYNAFYRTIVGLKGVMFRVEPATELPATVAALTDDVTTGGVGLHTFAQMAADELLTVGRVGLMADYPQSPPGATQADAQWMNLRPSLAIYPAESIINWKTGRVNNQHVLTMVVLKEQEEIPDGEFQITKEDRFRVLDLTPEGYRVRLFKVEKNTDVQIGPDVYPEMGNKRMQFIPFVFISPDDTTPNVFDPPLIDVADLNLSHYRTTADLEHGAHFTGLPTPIVSGYTAENETEKLYIGSQSAWVFPAPDANASYLEFTGQGLDSLFKLLELKEKQMAILGARMLETQKRAQEAAETATLHRQGEQSILAAMSDTFSLGMTKVLQWFSDWAGGSGEVSFKINTDFTPAGMSPQMLQTLVSSWQAGAMSQQAMFDNLKRGQLYDAHVSFEDEEERIRNSGPVMGGM